MFTKMKAPLIGVRKWKEIHDTVKKSIVVDVLAKWDLADTRITRKKIWDIARERYRGWRSNLHATYQAYKTDVLRFKNKPEDLNILEWEYLIHYFATDKKFQEISQKNSENRKKQKTQHVTGSKSFSQTSYEKLQENACSKISELEVETGNPVPTEDQNIVFQAIYRASTGCKTSQGRGQGYMAKAQTTAEMLHAQLDEQARITAETQQQNADLSCEVKDLEARLAAQKEESDRRLQAERNERLRFEQEQRNAQLKMQEEDRREREIFRKEMMEMLKGQIAASVELSEPSVQIPSENAEFRGPTKNNRRIENPAVVRTLFRSTFSQGANQDKTI